VGNAGNWDGMSKSWMFEEKNRYIQTVSGQKIDVQFFTVHNNAKRKITASECETLFVRKYKPILEVLAYLKTS
jgi:hypothetical protein